MTGDPLSVVFMGTPDFAIPTLKKLIDNDRFNLKAVVTQPDRQKGRGKKLAIPPVKKLALDNEITVFQPEKVREQETVDAIKSLEPDYLVVVAYGQILPLSLLAIPKLAPVNLHASLLPKYRGAAPIHRAFVDGETITGVCAMMMEEGLDTGDLLACRKTEITNDDTVGRLHDRLAAIGAALMAESLIDYSEGSITPRKQDGALATYAKKLDKSEFKIEWGQTSDQVSRRIRGLSPFPGAATTFKNETVKPLFAKALSGNSDDAPGVIQLITKKGIVVSCGVGSVLITEIKPEGKRAMEAHAFTLGRSAQVGDTFV